MEGIPFYLWMVGVGGGGRLNWNWRVLITRCMSVKSTRAPSILQRSGLLRHSVNQHFTRVLTAVRISAMKYSLDEACDLYASRLFVMLTFQVRRPTVQTKLMQKKNWLVDA